jgi:predicted aldo/keto reductase-like oxidoreductase
MGVMNADNPQLVKAALDAGIVHLDTAWYYQRGKNEEMIGKVIKNYKRSDYFLATKVPGFHEDRRTGKIIKDAKPGQLLEKFEVSLKRLDLPWVDVFYLHSVKSAAGAVFKPMLDAMAKLKKAGKVKYLGLSTHKNEPEVIKAAADSGFYDVVLTAYNFKQGHMKDVKKAIAYAAKKGMGIVAMKTQAGVYWDKEKLNPINMKAALKWALLDENVHTSIPGFTTFDQLKLDLSVMEDLKLTEQEKKDLKFGEQKSLAGLYCKQCGSCLSQCGQKLNIPDLMRCYMYAYGYKNLGMAKQVMDDLKIKSSACKDCSICTVRCSNNFPVRERVTDILRLNSVPGDFLV